MAQYSHAILTKQRNQTKPLLACHDSNNSSRIMRVACALDCVCNHYRYVLTTLRSVLICRRTHNQIPIAHIGRTDHKSNLFVNLVTCKPYIYIELLTKSLPTPRLNRFIQPEVKGTRENHTANPHTP